MIIDPEDRGVEADARAFACPGLYRIVAAKDGGICRVRAPLGMLTSPQAKVIASMAERFGNGIVELTNRANVQLRGMPLRDEPMLISDFLEAGLAPRERWADDTRNVLVNPTAGMDASDLLDVRPLANRILDQLISDRKFSALSPKFSIQIDGGGSLSVADHPHDIWLLAVEVAGIGTMLKIGLAGAIDYTADSCATRFIEPDACIEAVFAIVDEFLETGVRSHRMSRLRDLLSAVGHDAFWRRAEGRVPGAFRTFPADRIRSYAGPTTRAPLGLLLRNSDGRGAVGAMPPLGRMRATSLLTVAEISEELGTGEIRLTPWRSFLIPNIAAQSSNFAIARLLSGDLLVSNGDALTRVIACSGRSGCLSGLADAQSDARALAELIGGGDRVESVHISGCAKSCAVPGVSDITLVAVENGSYDLYRRDPRTQDRFGLRIAARIDIHGAAKILAGGHV